MVISGCFHCPLVWPYIHLEVSLKHEKAVSSLRVSCVKSDVGSLSTCGPWTATGPVVKDYYLLRLPLTLPPSTAYLHGWETLSMPTGLGQFQVSGLVLRVQLPTN